MIRIGGLELLLRTCVLFDFGWNGVASVLATWSYSIPYFVVHECAVSLADQSVVALSI